MRKPRPIKYVIIVVTLVILSQVLPVPYSLTERSYCPYCRAKRVDSRWMWVQRPSKISENGLTIYWRQNVEPGHVHTWNRYAYTEHKGMLLTHGDGYIDSRLLQTNEDIEIAILSSFRTPSERLAFSRSFLAWDWKRDQGKKGEWRMHALNELAKAYTQNPDRKDWQEMLKKLGAEVPPVETEATGTKSAFADCFPSPRRWTS